MKILKSCSAGDIYTCVMVCLRDCLMSSVSTKETCLHSSFRLPSRILCGQQTHKCVYTWTSQVVLLLFKTIGLKQLQDRALGMGTVWI